MSNKELFDRAIQQLEAGQYKEAIATFSKFILRPDGYEYLLARAYFNRGNSYKNLFQHEAAIADYDEAIDRNPNDAELLVSTYHNRGNTYIALGHHEKAIDDWTFVINWNLSPAKLLVGTYLTRVQAYIALGEYKKALTDCAEALKLQQDNKELTSRAYSLRGNAYAGLNQHDEAIASFEKALDIDPESMHALFGRMQSYSSLERYDFSAIDLVKLLESSSGLPLDDFAQEYREKLRKLEDFKPRKLCTLRCQGLPPLPAMELEFAQLNLFLGKNGTGKTRLLQLLHGIVMGQLYQPLLTEATKAGISKLEASLQSYSNTWRWTPQLPRPNAFVASPVTLLPAKEVMSLYRTILAQKTNLTPEYEMLCKQLLPNGTSTLLDSFEKRYEGESIVRNQQSQPGHEFSYICANGAIIPLQQGAEGVRKIQQLRLLLENGRIDQDSVLLLDEPEANLHPKFVRILMQIVVDLASKGVQVFMASHSYFVLEELLIASKRRQQTASCFMLTAQACIHHDLARGVPNNELLQESLDMGDNYDEVMFNG